MDRICAAAALIVTGLVIVAAAFAPGAGARGAPTPMGTQGSSELERDVRVEALSDFVVTLETQGTLTGGGDGDQSELDPDDELFGIVRVADLPSELRDGASVSGFSSVLYPGIDGAVDVVMLSSWDIEASLAFEAIRQPELAIGVALPTEPATTNVFVMVTRFPSEEVASTIAGEYDSGTEASIALRGFGDDTTLATGEFDFEEAFRDHERTYSEQRREPFDVTEFAGSFGERAATAVLDYDDVSNEYVSDRILYWHYDEAVTFTFAHYTVSIVRTSASLTDRQPDDVNVLVLAELIHARLQGAQR